MIDRSSPYFRQVELLVRVLPFLESEGCFAVKGGTAINLFVRDLPRLSVDINLVNGLLKEEHKRFLLSFKQGNPDWDALGVPVARELPAVQWKLLNIRTMSAQKRSMALKKLEQVLGNCQS